MINKKVQIKDGKFRIEVSNKEIEEQQSKSPVERDFWTEWLDGYKRIDEKYEALSEKEKAAYQKKYYATEKCYYYQNKKGETVPYIKMTLNTDWTWNVWDMERGIKYHHCSPVSAKNEDIIEEISIDYSFTILPEGNKT
jgi:hypothetical protein